MAQNYDFPLDVVSWSGTQNEYYQFINENYFGVCKNARVLEIGAQVGEHTRFILDQGPQYVECIEPHRECAQDLKSVPLIDTVVEGDAWLCINQENLFDVVVCFGLLYHHHSSLHLLEQIVNYNKPKYILLDNVEVHSLTSNVEPVNNLGDRQVANEWKHAGINIVHPFSTINQALSNMGYELTQVDKLKYDWIAKSNSWVALWTSKENQ
jgi:SAM-dependent methyltransferase